MSTDALFNALDDAAIKLLDHITEANFVSAKNEDGLDAPVTIVEHVKVFEAVVSYATLRAKSEPPKKLSESKFNDIQRRFRGDSDTPRGRARSTKPAPSAVGLATALGNGSTGS